MVSPTGSHPRESTHLTLENTGILKEEEEHELQWKLDKASEGSCSSSLYSLTPVISPFTMFYFTCPFSMPMRYVFTMTTASPCLHLLRVIGKLSQWPTNSFSLLYPLSNLVSGHFPLPVCHPLHLPCPPVCSRQNQAPSAPSKFRWMFFPSGVLFHFFIHGSLPSPPSVMCLNAPLCCRL